MSAQRLFISNIAKNYRQCTQIYHHPATLNDHDEDKRIDQNRQEWFDFTRTHRFTFNEVTLNSILKIPNGISSLSSRNSRLPPLLTQDLVILYTNPSTSKEEPLKTEDVNRSFTNRVAHMENNMGVNSIKANKISDGIKHFTEAANHKNVDAQFNLGVCNFTNNANAAIGLWDRACKDSHPSATYQLAVCYLRGNGLKQDKAQGIQLMQKAASLGSPDANYYLIVKSIKDGNMKQLKIYAENVKHDVSVREKLHKIMEKKGFPQKAKQIISSTLDA